MGKHKSNMASALPRAGEGDDVSWTKSLACLPKFSYFVIHDHLKDCGKKEIGDKAYKFFLENYVHDVYVCQLSESVSIVRARCHRSQRKNEDPHKLQIEVTDRNGEANISRAKCSCKAGFVFIILCLFLFGARSNTDKL